MLASLHFATQQWTMMSSTAPAVQLIKLKSCEIGIDLWLIVIRKLFPHSVSLVFLILTVPCPVVHTDLMLRLFLSCMHAKNGDTAVTISTKK